MAAAKAASKSTTEPEEMPVPGYWEELDAGKVHWVAGSTIDVCDQGHEVHPIHRSTTGWSCEHKTVKFTEVEKPSGALVVAVESSGDLQRRIAELTDLMEKRKAEEVERGAKS